MDPADPQLEYASPPAPREASPSRLFWLLLPLAMFVALLLGSILIETGDSRNLPGPLMMLALLPALLICGVMAIFEAVRPRGLRALGYALIGSTVLVAGFCLVLWLVLHFKLLRRF
jgi:hypothetical protein